MINKFKVETPSIDVDEMNIKKWLTESRFADKRYQLNVTDNFKIVTGAFSEDRELKRLPVPIIVNDNGMSIILDLTNDVKNDISPIDNIHDFLPSKGMGYHKLYTALAIYGYQNGDIITITKPLIKTIASIISNRISTSLSLDGNDRAIIGDLMAIHYTCLLYPDVSPHDLLNILKTIATIENIDQDKVIDIIKETYDMNDTLKQLKSLDVSERLKKLDVNILQSIFTGVSYMQMRTSLLVSISDPIYLLGIIYTTMKNPLYKRSWLYTTLKSNKKYMELDDTLDLLEKYFKSIIE